MAKTQKYLLKIFSILLVIIMLFSCVTFVWAEEDESVVSTSEGAEEGGTSDTITVAPTPSNEPKNGNYYISEDNVNISSPISGNAYVIGKTVIIDSVIDGNAFIMADEVTFTENSYVYTDAFVMAKKVNLAGYIYDLYCIANRLEVQETGHIIRDLFCNATDIKISGYIERDAHVTCSSLELSDMTQVIGQNLEYSSSKDLNIPRAAIGGKIIANTSNQEPSFQWRSFLVDLLCSILYALLIILILIFVFKNYTEKSTEILKNSLWKTLGYGILGLICVPVACVILSITLIGIPLALAILFVYIFALTLTTTICALPLARLLTNKIYKDNSKLTPGKIIPISLLVVLVLLLIVKIPYIGGVFSFLILSFGLGILLQCFMNRKNKKK